MPATVAILAFVLIWAAALVGWVLNIVALLSVVSDPITAMFVFRAVGIFVAPLGAVLGYL